MDVNDSKKYKAICKRYGEIKTPDGFPIIQGGYYDGEYFYIAFVHKDEEGFEKTRIGVLDKKLETVRLSGVLPLDHANNITYVKKLDCFLVTHCQSPDGHYYRYSLVDKNTLEIKKTADLEYPFFSMAYCEEKDAFASGEWGGQMLDYWDGELNNIIHRDVEMPKTLSQGCFAGKEGVYFVRSSMNGHGPEIRFYDWTGELKKLIPIYFFDGDNPEAVEPESINFANGECFTVSNHFVDGKHAGGLVYSVSIEEDND